MTAAEGLARQDSREDLPPVEWPLPAYLPSGLAALLLHDLERLWRAQTAAAKGPWTGAGKDLDDVGARGLARDLDAMSAWFEPTATGARLRGALEALPPAHPEPVATNGLFFPIREGAALVTPEGRCALWTLRRAEARESCCEAGAYAWIDPDDVGTATAALLGRYRHWSQHRLRSVTALLADETSTLRPTAAGLLLVLLVNRNTSRERALPRPRDKSRQSAISAAVAGPALAYAHALTGTSRAGDAGLDLYRGWALGELVRRLGEAIETGEAIYLRTGAEPRAVERLLADLRRREAAVRRRFPAALEAALEEYERSRPLLNGLGLAHERPANTAALLAALRSGVHASDDEVRD